MLKEMTSIVVWNDSLKKKKKKKKGKKKKKNKQENQKNIIY